MRPVLLAASCSSAWTSPSCYRVIRIEPGPALGSIEVHGWDPLSGPPPEAAFRGAEAVFNLAGESVAEGRWTTEKKRRIRESRVRGTENLVRGIERLSARPAVLVSASAVGYYGARGDEELDETSRPGSDFLAEVCQAWEAAAVPAQAFGVRVVNPRIGVVLGQGGVLAKMLLPFRMGAGGRLGGGRQWMPWVHVRDLIGLMLHAATHGEITGPMNATAPHPVTNRDFTQTLAGVLHRPAIFPVPELGLRVIFGEMAGMLLGSQRVLPKVAQRTGYAFEYPELQPALASILAEPKAS